MLGKKLHNSKTTAACSDKNCLVISLTFKRNEVLDRFDIMIRWPIDVGAGRSPKITSEFLTVYPLNFVFRLEQKNH